MEWRAACDAASGTGPHCNMNGGRADVGGGVASTSASVGNPIDESWWAGAAGDAGREARGDTESFILPGTRQMSLEDRSRLQQFEN